MPESFVSALANSSPVASRSVGFWEGVSTRCSPSAAEAGGATALSASEQTASNASARGSIGGECTIEAPYRRRQERPDHVELTAMGHERDIVIRVADLVDVDPCTGRLSIDGRVTSVVLTEEHRSLMEKMVRRLVDELPELPYTIDATVDFAPDGLPRVVLRLRAG